jgi:octaprenyl-diphosphate synthase
MVHMATLVHDDVLDEADTRRRGATINSLRGNEMAVMLGDYLIASSYHLCSQLGSRSAGLLVGRASMTMCEGELLQLHHRDNWSLDEPTYIEIVRKKTGALIGLACRLGALASKADETVAHALESFGERVGIAFQIQDDILDLTRDASETGKSSHKDLEKGKLTLPLIHHLETIDPKGRGVSLDALERSVAGDEDAARLLASQLRSTSSVDHARNVARALVRDATERLDVLEETDAKQYLIAAATAAVERNF